MTLESHLKEFEQTNKQQLQDHIITIAKHDALSEIEKEGNILRQENDCILCF